MHKLLLFTVLTFAGFSVAAQQQPSPAPQKQQPAAAKKDDPARRNYEWRMRAEGATGGTAPAPEREREGVGAGAKEHMHFDSLDRGLHRRSEAKVIAPAK